MARDERVTGTDAADIICHALSDDSGYRAPAEILAEKWGLAPAIKENHPMKWGKRMQVLIGEVYSEETGRTVEPVPDFTLWQHPDIPWLAASGDAIFFAAASKRGPLEIKTDGNRWEDGAAPLRHLAQNQIQQFCLKNMAVDGGALTAFVDRFHPLVSMDVEFNQAFIDTALPILEEFFHYLRTRTLPTDPSWYTKAATKAFWGHSNGATVALDHADLAIVERWEISKDVIKQATAAKDEAEVALAVRIGDNYAGALPDGSQYRIGRSDVEAQRCAHGDIIKAAHTRITPRRWWPEHLKKAMKSLSTKKAEATQ